MVKLKTIAFTVMGLGSGFIGVVAFIASLVGFGGPEYYHDDPIGVEMGLKIDTVGQEIFVWVKAPFPLYINTRINNIVKIEEEGTRPAELTDLIPAGDIKTGTGVIDFQIFRIPDEAMPDLRAVNQAIAPGAFVRKSSKFPTFLRYIMIMNAVCLNNWGLVQIGTIMAALGQIVTGLGIIGWNTLTKDKTVVQDIKLEEEEE